MSKKVKKSRPKKQKHAPGEMLQRAGLRPALVLEQQTHANKATCRCAKCSQ